MKTDVDFNEQFHFYIEINKLFFYRSRDIFSGKVKKQRNLI